MYKKTKKQRIQRIFEEMNVASRDTWLTVEKPRMHNTLNRGGYHTPPGIPIEELLPMPLGWFCRRGVSILNISSVCIFCFAIDTSPEVPTVGKWGLYSRIKVLLDSSKFFALF